MNATKMKPPEPDAAFEISLRPPMFSEFTGQVKGKSIEGLIDGKTPWSATLGG